MKKLLCRIILPLFLFIFNSCEIEESPILFSVENISNPENVKVDYFSPDPSCVEKSYTIWADEKESVVTLKCTNADPIFFNKYGSTNMEYNSVYGHWSAKLVDSTTIIFSFEAVENFNSDEAFIGDGLKIFAQDKKGIISTYISVIRFSYSRSVK